MSTLLPAWAWLRMEAWWCGGGVGDWLASLFLFPYYLSFIPPGLEHWKRRRDVGKVLPEPLPSSAGFICWAWQKFQDDCLSSGVCPWVPTLPSSLSWGPSNWAAPWFSCTWFQEVPHWCSVGNRERHLSFWNQKKFLKPEKQTYYSNSHLSMLLMLKKETVGQMESLLLSQTKT